MRNVNIIIVVLMAVTSVFFSCYDFLKEESDNVITNTLDTMNIQTNTWTWISDESVRNSRPEYGIKGVPDPAIIPGSRKDSVSWIDGQDNLWLFLPQN